MTAHNTTLNTPPKMESETDKNTLFSIRNIIWTFLVSLGTFAAWYIFQDYLDVYEFSILIGTAISLIWLGIYWQTMQAVSYWTTALTMLALWSYNNHGNVYSANEVDFFLRFFVSSQTAVMWMSVLFILATITYFWGLFAGSEFLEKTASYLTLIASIFGFVAMMVRWRETFMVNLGYGHIPVATLYEVFILFAVMTALLYLYYEQKMENRSMGGFALLIISASIAFLLWYSFDRGAYEIQPLVPALNSWWMKVHVPTNFVGYGTFAIAAMVGIAYLIKDKIQQTNPNSAFVQRLPSLTVMDDLMYKCIALGFAFFTLATVLGAMWAAEAWGGYWSWDPKETWSLITWLTYAGWLHIRMSKGWRGTPMAWWAIAGLVITTFTFLGVNMFLSGLHSYGAL